MRQIVHVFVKDVRHYWPESAVSMALMAAFAWYEIRSWADTYGAHGVAVGLGGFFGYRFLSGLVVVLVPVAWSFVVVRVIQGESLVGDRQFWITRPYEWKKLLAAKIFFVLAAVNLPLLIMDVVLLAKAGFPPTSYILGLLWMQLLIILFFMLPIAALATVTASVLQVGLTLLVILLYLIGVAELASEIPSSSFSSPADSLQAGLLIGTCIGVILWQYARRKTAKSRWLIVGLAALVVLIVVTTPYAAIVAREYPQLGAGQQQPVQLALLPAETPTQDDTSDKEKEVEIRMPLGVAGMASESIVVVSGILVSIEAPDGVRWNSGWRSPGLFLFPEQKRAQIDFRLKKDFFERVKSSAVKARISLAFTVYYDKNRREFVTPDGEFVMPDVGLCSTGPPYYNGRIHCRAPLRRPSFLLITSDLSKTTCPSGEGEAPANPGEIARGWIQNGDSEPAEFGISPVKTVDLYLSHWSDSTKRRISGMCPGTPLILSAPALAQRGRTEVEFSSARLADYRVSTKNVTFLIRR